MTNKLPIFVFVLGFVLIVISQSLFVVDQTEQAIVLQLGQPVGDIRQPGLHLKLPLVQEVRMFDKRILSIDPQPEQMVISSSSLISPRQTSQTTLAQRPGAPAQASASAEAVEGAEEEIANPLEEGAKDEIIIPPIGNVSGEPIIVDSYARYRISDPLQFMKTLGNVDNANKRIESIIDESTRTVLGSTTLKELLSQDRRRVMADINQRINAKIKEDSLGIEMVDVRIVRADLGEALRDSTVRRMISEMVERATETRAHGEQLALEIRAGAEKERTVIMAEAERDAQILRGEGDQVAIKTYADAFNQDKEFYAFMRSMEAYKTTLADQDTRLILSPNSDFFRFFESRRAK